MLQTMQLLLKAVLESMQSPVRGATGMSRPPRLSPERAGMALAAVGAAGCESGVADWPLAAVQSISEHPRAVRARANQNTQEVYLSRSSTFVGQQSIHKGGGIERFDILDPLAQPHQFHRQAKL